MEKIIQQGAEAVIVRRGNSVLKKRVVKGYRIKEMDDAIRRRRTRREARLLEKAGKLICVPKVKKVDERTCEIEMEFIDGKKLSEHLDDLDNWKEVCLEIGRSIGKLHDADIVHGDLTTSNMIWVDGKEGDKLGKGNISWEREGKKLPYHPPTRSRGVSKITNGGGQLYFIDFGLGFGNGRVEDKAVDLHLIKQALEAKHFGKWEGYFDAIVEGYGGSKGSGAVLKRLERVERRGRYKMQY